MPTRRTFAGSLAGLLLAACLAGCGSKGPDKEPILQFAAEPGPTETALGQEYSLGATKIVLGPMRTFAFRDAGVAADAEGNAALTFKIDDSQREEFRSFTAEHLHQRLGFFVEGRLVSAPVLDAELPGTGLVPFEEPHWTAEQVDDLAGRIRAQRRRLLF